MKFVKLAACESAVVQTVDFVLDLNAQPRRLLAFSITELPPTRPLRAPIAPPRSPPSKERSRNTAGLAPPPLQLQAALMHRQQCESRTLGGVRSLKLGLHDSVTYAESFETAIRDHLYRPPAI